VLEQATHTTTNTFHEYTRPHTISGAGDDTTSREGRGGEEREESQNRDTLKREEDRW
jgi:hypothetical protein